MIPRVLLLDESCDLHRLSDVNRGPYQFIVCLFWNAPETRERLTRLLGGTCYSLGDMIESVERWEREAYSLARRFCDLGPKYMDLRLRQYLCEPIYRDFLTLGASEVCLDFLDNLRRKLELDKLEVEFILSERNLNVMNLRKSVSRANDSLIFRPCLERAYMPQGRSSRLPLLKRMMRHFRGFRISREWEALAWYLVEKLDGEYRGRCRLSVFVKSKPTRAGGVTFFSSYLNNSSILKNWEPLMPGRVDWLVTNYYARKGISAESSSVYWIWEFGGPGNYKSRAKDDCAVDSLGSDSDSTKLEVEKKWLCYSRAWQRWTSGELSSVLHLSYCWENYLDKVKPKLVVVANQWGIEGWFTEIAKSRGIPILQVMHGAVGGYLYTQTPIISDGMVVPGCFWKKLWAADQRRKIIVYNPLDYIRTVEKVLISHRKRITFFSWPLSEVSFYSLSELVDGFIHIFHRVLSEGDYEVMVRAHPLENPSDFVRRWEELYGPLPKTLYVGKFEPLNHILGRTDVAVMFRSTAMLNCLVNSIPVIMPGWIDFGWNDALMNVPGMYLAPDFGNLEKQLLKWLNESPEFKEESTEYFISSSEAGREELVSLIKNVVES
jgi:hypothetical protein